MKTFLLVITFTQIVCSQNTNDYVQIGDSLYTHFIETVEVFRTKHFPQINKLAFQEFVIGYANSIHRKIIKKKNIAAIVDYSKSSNEQRFYVLDLDARKTVQTSLVAHGRNSGNEFARDFSNEDGSKKSCSGFLLTLNTYSGQHGYSLQLKGLEKDINDQSFKRAIVIHGAGYVSDEFIKKYGRLGRSWGCPALPPSLSRKIIDTIKGGSLLYLYAGNNKKRTASNLRAISKQTIATVNSLFGIEWF